MKILITGGAGFIGSHVAHRLVEAGHDVVIVDDLSTGSISNVPTGARFYEVDIVSAELDEIFDKERPDVVSHHAAQMNVRRSVSNPLADAQTNVLGSIRVIENSVRLEVSQLIFASSGGTVYGEPDTLPIGEDHGLRPISPYGAAKVAVENLLYGYWVRTGLQYVTLRYGNVYGPGQNPHGEAGIVSIFLDRLERGVPLTIYGDGEQLRDYVFIDDVVDMNLRALSADAGTVFNVGTGLGTTVNQIVGMLDERTGSRMRYDHSVAKPGDLKANVLGTARAAKELGWKPLTDLPDGLDKTILTWRTK